MSETITKTALRQLVGEWLAAGRTVAGPTLAKPGLVLYAALASPGALALDGFLRPANSIKEFLFPKHEELYGYRVTGKRLELVPAKESTFDQVMVGARPCDAAALPVLDHVFNWDYRDEFYNRRRRGTTIVTMACATHDDACFCTSVGLGPADERGSDALLVEMEGGYEVRCLTEKGTALFGGKTQPSQASATVPAGPEKKFDPEAVRAFARERFTDPFWKPEALACLGCGACAYTCPACHCFDMVDEGDSHGGVRVRNWDSCQFPLFTVHASGHNPRAAQGDRQRQRIYHKFHIYPEKFGEYLCTGCGNCARNCPAGLGVLPVVTEICHGEHLPA